MNYRLGIDVGGTNTDAVILGPDNRVKAKIKRPVTDHVGDSVVAATEAVLAASGLDPASISHAMLGTTQVTNAIIERRELNRVGVLRIGAPATEAIPPLTGWPADLRRTVLAASAIVGGGHEFDGRSIALLNRDDVRRFLDAHATAVDALAVTAVFSPVNPEHEQWVRDIVHEQYPHLAVSLSHEIGSVGLLERENATILNAAVKTVAQNASRSFAEALERVGVKAALYLAQNDGTLMAMDYALRYPILTIACGPTNSMRGAAYLSGLQDAVIIDVGGTSTDIGMLRGGFPRHSSMAVEIGGVRTNFRMPDLIALGVGGGSRVHRENDRTAVGPDSVGYRLIEEAEVFGGETTTFTDVAVALGHAALGSRSPTVSPPVAALAYADAIAQIEAGIDRIKTSAEAIPLVAVGGGSALLPPHLRGVREVLRPRDYDVANAIGAAIAEVSGRVDRIYALEGANRERVLNDARTMAEADAVRAGADPRNLKVVEQEEIPLAYLPGNASRIRVTVAGPLHD